MVWVVYSLIVIGVIIGYVGFNSVVEGYVRAVVLWFVAVLVFDGVDGFIVRVFDVRCFIF